MQQFAAVLTREIYRSSNGDRWLLARYPETCRVFVRHEPNLPSGGQVADIEIGAFLIAAGNGPEKQQPHPRRFVLRCGRGAPSASTASPEAAAKLRRTLVDH